LQYLPGSLAFLLIYLLITQFAYSAKNRAQKATRIILFNQHKEKICTFMILTCLSFYWQMA